MSTNDTIKTGEALTGTAINFSLPVYADQVGAGRRKIVETRSVAIELPPDTLAEGIKYAVIAAWRELEGWKIQPERLSGAMLSFWKGAGRTLSPTRRLLAELLGCYKAEKLSQLPNGAAGFYNLILAGATLDDSRVARAIEALDRKFPGRNWGELTREAMNERAEALEDLDF